MQVGVKVFANVGTKCELGRLRLDGDVSPERKALPRSSLVRFRYLATLEPVSLIG
jgi:hypothetical protein